MMGRQTMERLFQTGKKVTSEATLDKSPLFFIKVMIFYRQMLCPFNRLGYSHIP